MRRRVADGERVARLRRFRAAPRRKRRLPRLRLGVGDDLDKRRRRFVIFGVERILADANLLNRGRRRQSARRQTVNADDTAQPGEGVNRVLQDLIIRGAIRRNQVGVHHGFRRRCRLASGNRHGVGHSRPAQMQRRSSRLTTAHPYRDDRRVGESRQRCQNAIRARGNRRHGLAAAVRRQRLHGCAVLFDRHRDTGHSLFRWVEDRHDERGPGLGGSDCGEAHEQHERKQHAHKLMIRRRTPKMVDGRTSRLAGSLVYCARTFRTLLGNHG